MVRGRRSGRRGSFAERSVEVIAILGMSQLFTEEVTGVSTVDKSEGVCIEIILK